MARICFRRLFVTGMCISLMACSETVDNASDDTSGELIIGNAQSFTGPLANQGVEVEYGTDLAVAHINKSGGVLGKTLKLDKKDTVADVKLCSEIAEGFVEDGRKFVIGAISSGCTGAILDQTVPANVLTLTGVALATSLTRSRDNKGLFYRTGTAVAVTMERLAKEIQLAGNKSVALIANDNVYATAVAEDFTNAFEALNCGDAACAIAGRHDYSNDIDPNTYDFDADMEMIMADNADVLFFDSYQYDGLGYLKAAVRSGYDGVPYVSEAMGQGNVSQFLDDDVAAKIRWVDIASPNGRSYDYFKEEYEAAFKTTLDKSRLAEQVYDAIIVLALAIEKAGTDEDTVAVSDAIIDITNPPGEKVYADQYSKILEMIAEGKEINYEGASGSVDFDERGEVFNETQIMGYIDGEIASISE